MHREQLIGANAEAAVAKFLRHRFEITDGTHKAIDKNEIVARPVHFGKGYFHLPAYLLLPRCIHHFKSHEQAAWPASLFHSFAPYFILPRVAGEERGRGLNR
jgi:hypothetical protein